MCIIIFLPKVGGITLLINEVVGVIDRVSTGVLLLTKYESIGSVVILSSTVIQVSVNGRPELSIRDAVYVYVVLGISPVILTLAVFPFNDDIFVSPLIVMLQ